MVAWSESLANRLASVDTEYEQPTVAYAIPRSKGKRFWIFLPHQGKQGKIDMFFRTRSPLDGGLGRAELDRRLRAISGVNDATFSPGTDKVLRLDALLAPDSRHEFCEVMAWALACIESGRLVDDDTFGYGAAGPALRAVATALSDDGYFSPASAEDERKRVLREVVQRQGQPEFRAALVRAYAGRCAVTGCDAVQALEAAHIAPYSGPASSRVPNGLLLRADIHTLFDLDLIGVDPESLTVAVAPELAGTAYDEFAGWSLGLPANPVDHPDPAALLGRWESFARRTSAGVPAR